MNIASISDKQAIDNIHKMPRTGIKIVAELLHNEIQKHSTCSYEIWVLRTGGIISYNKNDPEASQIVLSTTDGGERPSPRRHQETDYMFVGIYEPPGCKTKKDRYEHFKDFITNMS